VVLVRELAVTSPTSGSRSVGIVRLRTEAMQFFYYYFIIWTVVTQLYVQAVTEQLYVQAVTEQLYVQAVTEQLYV
jgi:hypothetical protein